MTAARQKSLCVLKELRINGVRTNINFLIRLLEHPVFSSGDCRTSFIDGTPEILTTDSQQDTVQKLLRFLGDAVVNQSRIQGQLVRSV